MRSISFFLFYFFFFQPTVWTIVCCDYQQDVTLMDITYVILHKYTVIVISHDSHLVLCPLL